MPQHIDWCAILSPYPGKTLEEKFLSIKRDRTFRSLSQEVGIKEPTLKAAYQRIQNGKLEKGHVVRRKKRPNYAEIMGDFIRMVAVIHKTTERQFRRQIEKNNEEFERVCLLYGMPVFHCQRVVGGKRC